MTYGLLLSSLLVAAGVGRVVDPGERGPYAAGFTSFLLIDTSRPGDGGAYAHRPIPVFVWYPADASSIGRSTPLAEYPLDPLYGGAPAGGLPSLTSDALEKYGIDRGYEAPPVSADRPFPLLIFSPGWGAPAWAHASIGARLASHGFVVAVPYHFGDGWWPWEALHPFTTAVFNRPRDASLVLTTLMARNVTQGDSLRGAIRPDQVAAGGWSLGGYAAEALAAGDDDVCDISAGLFDDPCPMPPGTRTAPDPRFKAIVTLDGSNQVLHFDELARVTVPAMGMGEEWSTLAASSLFGASWQARQHAAFQGTPNYRVDVSGTIHESFSDFCEDFLMLGDLGVFDQGFVAFLEQLLCTNTTPSSEVHRLVNMYLVAFLKTNLAGEPGYQRILTPGYALPSEPLIEFFITEKRNPNAIDQDWPGTFTYFMHQPGSEQARAEKDPKSAARVRRVLERF
jgi:dienelactone hydrolase